MTYSVPVQPSSGTVTFSGSRYTFTPTAAARAAAAASQGADLATITVVASDGVASDSVTFTVPIMQSARRPTEHRGCRAAQFRAHSTRSADPLRAM